MANNIDVSPGEKPGKQAVATDEIGGVHYPIYKVSFGSIGEVTNVTSDNPLPTSMDSSQFTNQLVTSYEIRNELIDIGIQLKILNTYLSKWHGEEITHEDIEDDHH